MSSTEKMCVICCNNEADECNRTPEELKQLFSGCNVHLPSVIVTEASLNDIQSTNDNEMSVCKHCFHLAVEITRVADSLADFRKEMANLVFSFSVAVVHRRNVFHSAAEASGFPTNLCSENIPLEMEHTATQMNDHKTDDNPQIVNAALIEEDFSANVPVAYQEITVETTDPSLHFQHVEEHGPTVADTEGFSDMSESFFNEEFPDNSIELADLLEERLLDPKFSFSDSEMYDVEECNDNPTTTADQRPSVRSSTMSDAELMKTVRMPTIRLKRIQVPSKRRNGNGSARVCRRLSLAVKNCENSVEPKSVRMGKVRETKSVRKIRKVPPAKGKKNSRKAMQGIKVRGFARFKNSRKGRRRVTYNRKRKLLPPSGKLHCILRGSYFKVTKYNGINVEAKCQNCSGPSTGTVKGRYNIAQNFVRHLKNFHPKILIKYLKEEFMLKKERMIGLCKTRA